MTSLSHMYAVNVASYASSLMKRFFLKSVYVITLVIDRALQPCSPVPKQQRNVCVAKMLGSRVSGLNPTGGEILSETF